VLQNSTSICTAAPWSWQVHEGLELRCLARKLDGAPEVHLWSHATLIFLSSAFGCPVELALLIEWARKSWYLVYVKEISHLNTGNAKQLGCHQNQFRPDSVFKFHISYSTPWSFGVEVFGKKIWWSCWSSAPEPCHSDFLKFGLWMSCWASLTNWVG
jgi:hypothetical protein